jgi:Zn-finger nucleic acid-binding protein
LVGETKEMNTRAPIPCPICREPLSPVRFKGVPIDTCERHGIWLDSGELESILRRRERTITTKARRELDRANRDGKVSGALFGWFSLFFDRSSPF